LRDVGLREVVDPGAAAAALRVRDLNESDALDGTQPCAWLRAYPLPVREMTGVLVHDAQRPSHSIRPRPRHLGDVAHARTEFATTLRPRAVLVEHVAVGLEVRAAACRVHHDGQIASGERLDVETRERACLLAVAGMSVQRPAAD